MVRPRVHGMTTQLSPGGGGGDGQGKDTLPWKVQLNT